MGPHPTAARLAALLLLLVFGQLLDAAGLGKYKEPKGDLKVGLDYELATDRRHTGRRVFTSYLQFWGSTTSITDGQLTQMAMDAFDEMKQDMEHYLSGPDQKVEASKLLPGAMTVMAFDSEIILASSLKGRKGFLDQFPDDNPLKKAMEVCQSKVLESYPNAKPEHKSGANCGEISAFWRYYQLEEAHRSLGKIGDMEPRARVTTVGPDDDGNLKIFPPCGENLKSSFGCYLLVNQVERVNYILSATPEPYDLNEIAGGVVSKGQISSCQKNKVKRYK